MKKIISLLLCSTLLLGCFEDSGTDNTGSIAGTVSDYTVGDPIPVVNVVLNPGNKSTVTGTDGAFGFRNIPQGKYTIEISKNGYKKSEEIVYVFSGETSECQLLLKRIPAIVTTDRDTLDFGKSYNTMSFNIVNSSYEDMEWSVEENCKWITEVKPKSGVLKFGGSETIVIVIDRDMLDGGTNSANIVLRSTNGSTEVKVVAEGEYKTVPSVETYEVTNFSAHSATLNGEITNSGSPEYTERGFVYSTTAKPTIENCIAKVTSPKNSNVKFSYDIKNLALNQTYYARAYAKNVNGISYGRVVEFTTTEGCPTVETLNAKNVNASSATIGGRLTENGGDEVFERGVCWDTEGTPNINDNHKYISGDETGEYWIDVNGLKTNTKYYARAYAKNKNGVSYGRIIEFTTVAGLPTVESLNAKNINAISASLGGELISNGGYRVQERGVCWDTEGTPNINDNHKYISGDETGEYWIDVNDLKTNTKYYACAYAKNENGVSYGRIIEFTTVAGLPTVESLNAKNVTARTASLGGRLISNGGYKVYERGICWDTNGSPNIDKNYKYISGDETGDYWIDVNNLNPSTKYYACAYAKNENGVSYGNLYEFTTTGSQVTISIGNITNITSNSATLVASIGDAGSPAYTECGFCYSSSSQNPTIYDNSVKSSFTGAGQFTCSINRLDYNYTYYVRAYAIQNGEVIYSSVINFKPSWSKASVTLNDVTNIEETTATFKANVTNAGDPNITEKGFCWSSSSSSPTIDMERKVVSGTYKGSYNLNISNLNKGTTYYVRAYVIQNEEVIYSNTLNFTTIKKPIVATESITNLKPEDPTFKINYSVTFNGTISDAGIPAYTQRGFVYSEYSSPTVGSGTTVTVSGTGTGKFSKEVNGLFASSYYYVRAFVKTENGYIYGETVQFDTW